jgi:hypothetical protein
MLDLPARAGMYVRNRLHDKDRKIRNNTPFFKPNRTLPTNGFTREKTKPIPTKKNDSINQAAHSSRGKGKAKSSIRRYNDRVRSHLY